MNVSAVMMRIIRQFVRDKRSLALLIMAPVLVLTLIWLVLDGNEYHPTIAVESIPAPLEDRLHDEFNKEILTKTEAEAKEMFEQGKLDAYVSIKDNNPFILLEGSDPTANGAVMQHIQSAFQVTQSNSTDRNLTVEYFYGSENINLFDQVGSVLIGFFVFFFVFILGGISFLRERTQGTLEKLLSTPIKRWQLVTGYIFGFGIFTIIQSLIIVFYSVYVLDIWMAGSVWELLIVTVLLALTALTLAILLSAFAKNEFQIMQFIPLVIIPQVFFSGIFNLDTLAEWIQALSKIMPLTYGAEAMQEIMIKGKGILEIWDNLVVLCMFAFVFFVLNLLALKKHRRL
ncbi:ABC-2 type transport system permease protein [Salirhabdus euzebyi]|uniref:ABC-2 type transport system permease protein n=1 Tax=Salirhabdus euzebyi TaxID=394506 RepID=A0A841QAD8_9BACI|nr:ABC transporter permease [Salirhabdus euzebyi]MBB6455366.1 ABC-2 type transport system permease protein [Salirhabdus euzebyi]